MIPVVGPFLVLGLLAWLAAIVIGTGAWFGLTSWQTRWFLAGALAGFGTLELYLHVHSGALPVFVSHPALAFPTTAALFVGGGIAAAFGTACVPRGLVRPALEPGSPEEILWLADAVDRLRTRTADRLLAGALVLPGAGLVALGATTVSGAEVLLAGALALAGPIFGAVGLALRDRTARRYQRELAEAEGHGQTRLSPQVGGISVG